MSKALLQMGRTKLKVDSLVAVEEPKKRLSITRKKPVEVRAEVQAKLGVKAETKPQNLKTKPRGQKYQQVLEMVDRTRKYPVKEAVELAQKTSYSKFSGTIEAHINTTAKNIRGLVSLPHMAGKALTILAFGKDADKSGADIVGNDQVIANIDRGKINFDILIVTPDWMPKLAKLARILGPRGLMPNPKNDTITQNIIKTVADLKAGKTEFKTEAGGKVIHLGVGKVNQPTDQITANLKVLYTAIGRSKVEKITLSPTMGPGVKVDPSTLT